jgi:hypothetical protein
MTLLVVIEVSRSLYDRRHAVVLGLQHYYIVDRGSMLYYRLPNTYYT